ncbi:MAG: hypothetical protein ACI927_000909 [Oceanospirillaceae bacterium]|jgi:hypothetical protein|tara:strand:- start:5864 stop:6004 length:141 start_codon:yes stop_codon:yes gene_type:complete
MMAEVLSHGSHFSKLVRAGILVEVFTHQHMAKNRKQVENNPIFRAI